SGFKTARTAQVRNIQLKLHWATKVSARKAFLVFDHQSSIERFHHFGSKPRADTAFFVLEVNENLAPFALLFTHGPGPTLDVALLIIFAPQPEITVIRRDLWWRCHAVGIGDTEGDMSRLE